MKKTILIICFIASLLSSCDENKQSDKKNLADSSSEKIDENIWKDIKYTRDELNEEFGEYGPPWGLHFFDEFPELKSLYNLSPEESAMLGLWRVLDGDIGLTSNQYYFYPNKLFIFECAYIYYKLNADEDVYLNRGVGLWNIKNGKVSAKIYFFLPQKGAPTAWTKEDIVNVTPYEVELIDLQYIDTEVGYSKRPFNKFDIPIEWETERQEPLADHEYLLGRVIYYPNDIYYAEEDKKNYLDLRIAPDMAREGVSGLDIIQSPELIDKYIWSLWP